MSILTRDAILKADDRPTERVAVPEWGGDVIVRGMTVRERDGFEASLQRPISNPQANGKRRTVRSTEVDLDNFRSKLVVRSVVDENGKRVFADSDADELGAKAAAAVSRIANVAQRLNGMSDQDVEELTGNSDAMAEGASSSDSRSPSAEQSRN